MAKQHRRRVALYSTGQTDTECVHRVIQRAAARRTLERGMFTSLADARCKIAKWRYDYNNIRPHSALNGQSPATARRALELLEGSTHDALAKQQTMSYVKAGLP